MSIEEKTLLEMLYQKHNKLLLSKSECAKEVGVSCSSLDRYRKKAVGMQYIKRDDGNIYYPISEVVKFIIRSQTKTI